jgi:hypothetical protein
MEPTMKAGAEPGGEARSPLGPVVQIDEERIRTHLDEVVRCTVEETLNALLDAEADHLGGARKYERTEGENPPKRSPARSNCSDLLHSFCPGHGRIFGPGVSAVANSPKRSSSHPVQVFGWRFGSRRSSLQRIVLAMPRWAF